MSVVTLVDSDDMAVTVEPSQPWDADLAVHSEVGSMRIIHAEPDELWVKIAESVMGQQVKQNEYLGSFGNGSKFCKSTPPSPKKFWGSH